MSDTSPRTPKDPRHAGEGGGAAFDTRAPATPFVWGGVIVALGAVWWWVGREEPAPLRAPSEWAEGLERRELSDVAGRRTQAARQLIQRQGLGAHGEPRPNWNAARLRAAIPVQAAPDAGPAAR